MERALPSLLLSQGAVAVHVCASCAEGTVRAGPGAHAHPCAPITHCPSSVTHRPSPVTHCPSPTTHHPSSVTHRSSPSPARGRNCKAFVSTLLSLCKWGQHRVLSIPRMCFVPIETGVLWRGKGRRRLRKGEKRGRAEVCSVNRGFRLWGSSQSG